MIEVTALTEKVYVISQDEQITVTTVVNQAKQGYQMRFQGYWDASTGRLPSYAEGGWMWIIGDGITDSSGGGDIPYGNGTVYLAARSMLMALKSNPGQNFFNWVNF
jgi:hypothetical protein